MLRAWLVCGVYAVKNSIASDVKVRVLNELSICDEADRISENMAHRCAPDTYRTRPGLELIFELDEFSLSLLNVHLKSSCRTHPLNQLPPHATECNEKGYRMLKDQVPVLEAWIDQKVQGGELFMVVGDFNRNFAQEFKKNMPARLNGSVASDPIKMGLCHSCRI